MEYERERERRFGKVGVRAEVGGARARGRGWECVRSGVGVCESGRYFGKGGK